MPLYDLHFAKTSFLEDSVALFWPDLSELSPNFGVLEIRGQWHRPPMSLVRRLLRLRLVKLGGECTSSNPFPLLPLRVLDFLQLYLWRQGMWLLKDLTLTSVFALSQSSLHLLLWTPFPLLDPFSHVNDEYKESCLMIRQVILSSPTHVRSMIHAKRDIIIEWLIIICCSVSVKLFPRFFFNLFEPSRNLPWVAVGGLCLNLSNSCSRLSSTRLLFRLCQDSPSSSLSTFYNCRSSA